MPPDRLFKQLVRLSSWLSALPPLRAHVSVELVQQALHDLLRPKSEPRVLKKTTCKALIDLGASVQTEWNAGKLGVTSMLWLLELGVTAYSEQLQGQHPVVCAINSLSPPLVAELLSRPEVTPPPNALRLVLDAESREHEAAHTKHHRNHDQWLRARSNHRDWTEFEARNPKPVLADAMKDLSPMVDALVGAGCVPPSTRHYYFTTTPRTPTARGPRCSGAVKGLGGPRGGGGGRTRRDQEVRRPPGQRRGGRRVGRGAPGAHFSGV